MNDTELIIKSQDILVQAKNPITDQASYNAAAEVGKSIKALLKEADSIYDASIEAAHKAHKAALDLKKKETTPLLEADKIVRAAMGAWITEQERLRRIEEQKQREAQAEAERIAREKQKDEAAALADLMGEEEAKAVANATIVVPTIAPVAQVEKSGIAYRETWYFEVTCPGEIPREFLMVDEAKVKGVIAAMKGATNIPGIVVMSKRTPII